MMWNKKIFWGLTAAQITTGIAVGACLGYAGLKTYDEMADYWASDVYDDIRTNAKIEREYRAERDKLLPTQKAQQETLDQIIAARQERADQICRDTFMPYRINCEIQKTWLRYRRETLPKSNP